jgi:hypothetical protein
MSNRIYRDFDIFSRALIGSRDVDPTYIFIKNLLREKNEIKPEWFAFCYVAFYSLETAYKMCEHMPTPKHWDSKLFEYLRKGNGSNSNLTRFGHERRGTARNVNEQIKMFDYISEFVECIDTRKNPIRLVEGKTYFQDNNSFKQAVQNIPQHSVWAAFKLAEIFEKSLGYNQFAIPDLGLDGRDPNSTDGPVGGLRTLFGTEEQYDKSYFKIWNEFGFKLADAWKADIGEVETCFCKWYKFKSGKYYINHDIDELIELKHTLGKELFEQCVIDFDQNIFLNKKGVEKDKKSLYKDTGVIYNSHYHSKIPKCDVVEIMLSL